jgi:hypothetical protein
MSSVVTSSFTSPEISNYSFEQFFMTFKTTQLDMSTFWLVNSGFCSEERRYAHVILRACQIRPLYGPHLVSVFYSHGVDEPEMKTFWVHSLTHLRRNMFCFEDRLSFERSTYLVPYQDGRLLIRLKSIRAFLTLPVCLPQSPSRSIKINTLPDAPSKQLTLKMKQLLNHHIEAMISYLNREMQLESSQSIDFLDTYIRKYIDSLKVKMR